MAIQTQNSRFSSLRVPTSKDFYIQNSVLKKTMAYRLGGFPRGLRYAYIECGIQRVSGDDTTNDWHYETALAFQVPTLQGFGLCGASGEERHVRTFEEVPVWSSSAKHMFLHLCSMPARSFKVLLQTFQELRAFEGILKVNMTGDKTARPGEVLEGLLPHAESLQYVYLDFNDDWDQGWKDEWKTIPLGTDLAKFMKLRMLTTGMQSLTGFLDCLPETAEPTDEKRVPLVIEGSPTMIQCLPHNLEYLQVHSCGPAMLEQAQGFLDAVNKGERFKRLKTIRFVFRKDIYKDDEERFRGFNPLELECHDPSVKLEIVLGCMGNPSHDDWQLEEMRHRWLH